MASICRLCYIFITIFSYICTESHSLRTFSNEDVKMYREKVKQMFNHAYDNYLKSAFPYDELQPISCRGMDTWGSFSLTLIDALDTLAVMKNYTEFRRVVHTLLSTADFNVNINVSVFETNIRVVGGLLSAHLLSRKAGLSVDPGWPCSGPLLNLAEKVARKLLPAFNTSTGMPYGTVNLKYGVPVGETPITCTAGVSTFIIEFGTLSHLTGDPVFENVAVNALDALWKYRSSLGLVGNHINIQDGKWTALDAGIGGGVDSYFEYLVKGAILFQEPKYLKMFKEYERLISKYMKRDDWYFWVSMSSGQVTMPTFQSLEAFWPGLLTLIGDIEQAVRTLYNYHQIWKQYGFMPEIYDVAHNHAKRENYPLRPELIESIMYLYYATKDQHLLEIGVDILESIEHSAKTDCGYATIKNVIDHKIEDRMESFFLAETTKYLYLLFDPENFIHNNGSCGEVIQMSAGNCVIGAGGYVFNTEAHPIDVGAVYCCSAKHFDHQMLLHDFQKSMDLHSLLEIRDSKDFLKPFRNRKTATHRKRRRSIEPDVNNIDNSEIVASKTDENSTSAIFNSSNLNENILSDNESYLDEENKFINRVNADLEDTSVEVQIETDDLGSRSVDANSYSTNEIDNYSNEEITFNKKNTMDKEANNELNILDQNIEIKKANVDQDIEIKDQNIIGKAVESDKPNIINKEIKRNPSVIGEAIEINELNIIDEEIEINQPIIGEAIEINRQNVIDQVIKVNQPIIGEAIEINEPNIVDEEIEINELYAPQFNSSVAKNESEDISANYSTIISSKDSTVYVNSTSSDIYDKEFYNYELLSCPAQPYSARLNLMGEMFNT